MADKKSKKTEPSKEEPKSTKKDSEVKPEVKPESSIGSRPEAGKVEKPSDVPTKKKRTPEELGAIRNACITKTNEIIVLAEKVEHKELVKAANAMLKVIG